MNYWWVNHKQTFKVEIGEGYIWSPKAKNNGRRNEAYDNLTRTKIGDIVFSYAHAKIIAVGIVLTSVIESPRPINFGKVGNQWADKGWLVPIQWKLLTNPISPKKYISAISPLLPAKYSPLKKDGDGNQGFYLTSINQTLGRLLVDMIDIDDIGAKSVIHDLQDAIQEEQQVKDINEGEEPPTVKVQLIEARVGQGCFRNEVEKIESKCRVTGLQNKAFLIASHIKPWRNSTNAERLNGHNGLLLSPHVDRLFDRGYISFADNGKMLIANTKELSPILNTWSLKLDSNVGSFTKQQKYFLSYHRDEIHKKKIEDFL